MTKDISDRGNAATAPGAVPLGNIDGRWTRGTFTEAGLRTHTRGGGGVGEGEGVGSRGVGGAQRRLRAGQRETMGCSLEIFN